MKLRNKKTGEIIDLDIANIKAQYGGISVIPKPFVLGSDEYVYNSLSELCAEWEDVPEEKPKEWWTLSGTGRLLTTEHMSSDTINDLERIGNKFETAAECELAAKKLRALKRLKDKGLKFEGWCDSVSDNDPDMIMFRLDKDAWGTDTRRDLDLLFGGEE